MTTILRETSGFHRAADASQLGQLGSDSGQDTYKFENFFHPFVGDLIAQLNRTSVAGFLDPSFLQSLSKSFFTEDYTLLQDSDVHIDYVYKTIDVMPGGPYANYNWELLYHIPIAGDVHVSKIQRCAEAQK